MKLDLNINEINKLNEKLDKENTKVLDRVVEININKIIPNELNFYNELHKIDELAQSIKNFNQQ